MKCFFLMVCCVLLTVPAMAGQRVVLAPGVDATTRERLIEKGLEQAMAQTVRDIVDVTLPPERLAAVARVLVAERSTLILDYNELSVPANATEGTIVLDVHADTAGIRRRLAEMGVLYTVSSPRSYVLRLLGVDPSRTRRLEPLQMISGLRPVSSAGPDVPVLELRQEPPGSWTGVLTHGTWKSVRTARTLEEMWWYLWKGFFSRSEGRMGGDALTVSVSGWLSSMGPMEFDRMLDGWTAEIGQRALTGVEMGPGGLVGVWKIQAKRKDALVIRLRDAAKAQGLDIEIK